jgi:uncharacterized coiled-coil DUF342 family protein
MTKASKPGYLKLHNSSGAWSTISSAKEAPQQFEAYNDELQTVFKNGEVFKDSYATIKNRVKSLVQKVC